VDLGHLVERGGAALRDPERDTEVARVAAREDLDLGELTVLRAEPDLEAAALARERLRRAQLDRRVAALAAGALVDGGPEVVLELDERLPVEEPPPDAGL